VWSEGRICALWDSLLRGFPLPSFLLVQGKLEQGKGYGKDFQDTTLDPHGQTVASQGEFYHLLDGQQRLTAIDVITRPEEKPIRLWLDLAPKQETHPLKFKYWLHACTRMFPFGFRMEADGEHDFATLRDHDIRTLWQRLQESKFQGKEFHEIPLAETRPYKAGCPVPLDELVHLIDPTQQKVEDDALREAILRLAEVWKQDDFFQQVRREPDETTVDQVARGLARLQTYTLTFQLLSREAIDDEDDYTLYERIGRGGVQITQRQLAVAKLMLELGREGNDVIAAFQSSEKLQHLLETEDVIHALARVAFTATEPEKDEDLLDLTPQRLKTLQKDTPKWGKFIEELRGYCRLSKNVPHLSRLQHAFEQLYTSLRYREADNPYGVPFVQLAQPTKTGEGIAPLTLHPLVYWYLMCADGQPADPTHREDMLRWVVFANGFTHRPQHPKLNTLVFQSVVKAKRLDFASVKNLVFQDENEKLRNDLGFTWQAPIHGDVIQREHRCEDIPTPEEVTSRTARRLILQNWSSSGINRFLLMWNQREVLEKLYGAIDYRPALFSKGRPFDADHIVARNRFLFVNISDDEIRRGIKAIIEREQSFEPVAKMQGEVTTEDMKLAQVCFRRYFPNTIANYRYWPKRLNISDGKKRVAEKINNEHVQGQIACGPLHDCFPKDFDTELLLEWSALPKDDASLWRQLPPEESEPWSEDTIGLFTLAALKREQFLYTNAYRFLVEEL
jgi:hypothetical protein